MKRNILLAIAMTITISLLLVTACAQQVASPIPTSKPSPTPAASPTFTPTLGQKTYDIQFLASSIGGTAYPAYAGVASILNRHGPFRVTLVETAGAIANYPMADQVDPNTMVYANAGSDYAMALRGMKPLTKKYTKIRWIAGLVDASYTFASIRPEYRTLDDMVGKKVRIAMQPKPYGSTVAMLEVLNIKGILKTATLSHMGWTSLADAVKDDLADVFTGQATQSPEGWDVPTWFADVMQAKGDKIHAISLPEDVQKQAFENTGLYFNTTNMPPGVFGKGQTQPAVAMEVLTGGLGCQSDMDANLVYLITKIICENWQELGQSYPQGKYMSPSEMYRLMFISSTDEIHPGAIRYYKEVGVAK